MTTAPLTLAGQILDGKYRLTRMIGKGGMGAVHEAEHVGTGRTVAIKTILPALVGDAGALERFRREARAAGRLRHPNIVDVTDFGVALCEGHEVAYLAMEYLEGTTLNQLIRSRGALPVDLVVAIVEQIALALEAAHRLGVVHRDLKPDNVWLVPDPRGGYSVRVLDFGIAKLRDAPSVETQPGNIATFPAASWSEDATMARSDTPAVHAGTPPMTTPSATEPLTVAGTTLGTPAYMSPEQCRGGAVDARSDIYSLGVIAYEALSGRRPFTASNLAGMISAHLHDTPPPLDHGVPSRVAAVVSRALAKDADDRFQSAMAMAGSLYAASEGAAVILRRSIALYVDRFVPFLRVSLRASAPGLIVLAVLLAVSLVEPRAALPMVVIASLSWSTATLRTNAAFAVVIDHLRRQPLEAVMRPDDVAGEVRRRLGLPPDAGGVRTFLRLFAFYLKAELRASAGAGDLAFLIAFLEGRPATEVPERCSTLAKTVTRSYGWIRASIFVALFLPPVVEFCVILAIATAFRVPQPIPTSAAAAAALIPVNALLVNPVFSSALALVYFRARQANGEDVGLASVVSGRL